MSYINKTLIFILGFLYLVTSNEITRTPLEYVQKYNTKTLKAVLSQGWKSFCESDVDEVAIAVFPGNDPSDATIQLVIRNNETLTVPIHLISKLAEFGLDPRLKTIIYVNTMVTDHIYDIRGNLNYMQKARKDYNIIVVDFAQSILQLYNTIKHNVFINAYFISKIISTLVLNGINEKDIILIGHSVGANIAALGGSLYSQEEGGRKVSTLIAIDPAIMCQRTDVFVNPQACKKVVVIHGENDVFSVSEPLGTIDIFLNGVLSNQPGCNTKMCSHVYPFLVFLDAVIEKSPIIAVKCDSWASFRRNKCDYSTILSLDFEFTNTTSGKYYCITNDSQPFGLGQEGMKYKKIHK